jgi:ribosomal protein S18 acetylase RimI-like enzyme
MCVQRMDTDKQSEYVALIMSAMNIQVVIADRSHLKALHALVQSIAATDHRGSSEIAVNASEGLRSSLDHFNTLDSDCGWILIAFVDDQPAGVAILARIPKLDTRLGFLYLDELHVTPQYRRQGVGKALLTQSISLTRTLGLSGLRLLARIDNEPARCLYEAMGFTGNETMLYQVRFDREDMQP